MSDRGVVLVFLLSLASSTAALTTEEIEQYRAGAGMGYAKAAELNHFPGPMHVLELAVPLSLSAEQRTATERLQGEYRLSHLETHRRMRALLTAEQIKRYDELRGYGGDQHQHRKH